MDTIADIHMVLGVAPLVGAWIEIIECEVGGCFDAVAPLVGAWIEIYKQPTINIQIMSLLL